MLILKTVLDSDSELLDRYLDELPDGGLFVPTRRVLEIGKMMAVSVRLRGRADPVFLRASVAWVRAGRISVKVRAGIGVAFAASESKTRRYLLSIARGELTAPSARRHPRIPVDLPVQWRNSGANQFHPGELCDMGRGGAFLRTGEPVHDSQVAINIVPPGAALATVLVGKVVWNSPGTGVGVSWVVRGPGESKRIKELVRRLEEEPA